MDADGDRGPVAEVITPQYDGFMRSVEKFVYALLSISVAACTSTPPARQHDAEGGRVVELFNGVDLTGWVQRGGRASYRVEDGCIVGATRPNQPNSFLCTTSEYSDFVLELEFMADADVNSGVQIRSESRPGHQNGRVHGYQIEIDTSARMWTGGLYDEGRRGWIAPLDKDETARAAYKPGGWNHLRIEAIGDRICSWVNGVPAAHVHDSMTAGGFIALQVHDVGGRTDELTIRWRNLRLTSIE